MVDFILPRIRSLSAAKPSHFLSRAGEANCRFIKAGQSQWPFYQSRWQFYQGWPAYGRFINNGRFIKVEDQAAMAALSIRSGRMASNGQVEPFLEKAGEASGRFIRPASRSGRFIKAGQPQCQF